MEFLTPYFLVALAVAAVAGLMRGFAGVGSGMLMAPVFAILFGPVQTVAIVILMEIVVTAQLLPGVHREINWKLVLPMGFTAAIFMPFGSWLLVSIDPDLVARFIALVVFISSLILLAGWRYRGGKKLWATIGVGAFSGVLMASTSLGNPPVMVYLLSSRDAAATNRANFTGYFAITLIMLTALMAFAGLIGYNALVTAAMLLPVFVVAAWVGGRLFLRSGEATYRRVVLGLLCCVGLYLLIR
ncbi:MAG: sulfite exporter TauE/SafE family protein [Rhodospirillaceae bacterium]|nr:sulfite exporter TauE/SafE family protein [Rhodospirillaceae bacterium]